MIFAGSALDTPFALDDLVVAVEKPANVRGSQLFPRAFAVDELELVDVACELDELEERDELEELCCDDDDARAELECPELPDPPDDELPCEDPPEDLLCALAWMVVKERRTAAEAKIETNRDLFLMAASLLTPLTFHHGLWLP